MAGGSRESHWLVIRRCLAIVRRVQRGPATWRELVQAVLAEDAAAYGSTQDRTLYKRLRNDLDRLRHNLYLNIRADRRTGEYALGEIETPLLDLPDEELATLAWLEQIFHPNSPKYREVRALLQQLQSYLAPERRLKIEQHRTALVLDLGQRDEDRLDPRVETRLIEALTRRRRVEFDYRSPEYAAGQLHRHVVDFYEPPYFDTERGHYYVYGWCHYTVAPAGQSAIEDYRLYRLGRISNVRLLPDKLPQTPPPPRQYPVTYWLAPAVARDGVTQRRWIVIDRIERQAGGVIVHGTTPHPFMAVQELMHYRANCRVLGGPEMADRMRQAVIDLAQLYEIL